MKISEAIEKLQEIQNQYGDLEIIGGHMMDDYPIREIAVLNKDGMKVYPTNLNGVDIFANIDCVFMEM